MVSHAHFLAFAIVLPRSRFTKQVLDVCSTRFWGRNSLKHVETTLAMDRAGRTINLVGSVWIPDLQALIFGVDFPKP